MIVFDLQCEQHHGFEAWFASSAAFEDQRATGQVLCPYCASARIEKAVMAPRLQRTGSAALPRDGVMRKLAALQREMLHGSTWVGDGFADQARAMHEGLAIPAIIHGSATLGQARALHDDGVAVMPLMFPVVPPKKLN